MQEKLRIFSTPILDTTVLIYYENRKKARYSVLEIIQYYYLKLVLYLVVQFIILGRIWVLSVEVVMKKVIERWGKTSIKNLKILNYVWCGKLEDILVRIKKELLDYYKQKS